MRYPALETLNLFLCLCCIVKKCTELVKLAPDALELPMWPPLEAGLATDLLQHSWTNIEVLGCLVDGTVEMLRDLMHLNYGRVGSTSEGKSNTFLELATEFRGWESNRTLVCPFS